MLRDEYEKDERDEERGIFALERVISRKLVKPYILGFKAIIHDDKDQKTISSSKYLIKNVATNMFHLLNYKMKENKDFAFRNLMKVDREMKIQEPDLHVKGMLLMGLKEYPRQNKRSAFYSWYLKSTQEGQSLLQKLSNRLVLETNINKTTAFYRLFRPIKGKKTIVSPKIKRFTIAMYLYSRIFVERQKQEFFQKFKIYASKERAMGGIANKIIDCSKKRMREAVDKWRILGKEEKNKTEKLKIIQRMIYKTKIGRLLEGFLKWKALPPRKTDESKLSNGHKFERGLTKFV
jgi:hypothetical protein